MILSAVNDTGLDARGFVSVQRVTGSIMAGDPDHPNVAHVQAYGLTSVPPIGAEGIALEVGASPGRMIAILFDDPRTRPKDKAAGEVYLWTDEGEAVKLKRNRQHTFDGDDTTIEGTDTVTLKVGSTTIVVNSSGITIDGKDWITHKHSGVDVGAGNTGGVV